MFNKLHMPGVETIKKFNTTYIKALKRFFKFKCTKVLVRYLKGTIILTNLQNVLTFMSGETSCSGLEERRLTV